MLVQRWEAVQAIFQGQTAPPHRKLLRVLRSKRPVFLSGERPSYHHVTLSGRQVTVPNAIILLATSRRNVAEVTSPQRFAFLKERIVLRCCGAVVPDEKTENN